MERSSLEEAVECVERTLAADSARISLEFEMDAGLPPGKRRRSGGLLGPLMKLGGAAGRMAWEHVASNLASTSFEGYVEPSRHRHMLASPRGWNMMLNEDRHYNGAAGRRLATLEPSARSGFPFNPFFLLDSLRGLDGATPYGEEVVRGAPSSRLAVVADIPRASAATPGGIQPPSVDRYEDLLALPLTFWIDGIHVRRIRYEEQAPRSTATVELWDFGVSTEDLDWSRLPSWSPSD